MHIWKALDHKKNVGPMDRGGGKRGEKREGSKRKESGEGRRSIYYAYLQLHLHTCV